jgi:hypothetical protein
VLALRLQQGDPLAYVHAVLGEQAQPLGQGWLKPDCPAA